MKLINFKKSFFAFIFSCSLISTCFAMENAPADTSSSSSETPTTTERSLNQMTASSTTDQTPSVYIPQHYDVSEMLHRESVCCFRISRYFLQPLNVIAPLFATGFVGVAEYIMDDNPKLAKILNGIGLACNATQFVTSVLLIKINDKQQGIDEYITTRQQQQPVVAQQRNTPMSEISET